MQRDPYKLYRNTIANSCEDKPVFPDTWKSCHLSGCCVLPCLVRASKLPEGLQRPCRTRLNASCLAAAQPASPPGRSQGCPPANCPPPTPAPAAEAALAGGGADPPSSPRPVLTATATQDQMREPETAFPGFIQSPGLQSL